MGFLLILSALLAWPLHWLIVSASIPFGYASAPSWLSSRANWECWLLTLLFVGAVAIAIPNLKFVSRTTRIRVLVGILIAQPVLLTLFRWPLLASVVWDTTGSLTIGIAISMLPGLLLLVQTSRSLGLSLTGWAPLLVSLTVCAVFDLAGTLGIIDLTSQLDISHEIVAPWGLILTLLLSGWISSMLIPYWFLWCSDSDVLEDERAAKLRDLWLQFHPQPPRVYLWPTGCRVANAVLLGNSLSKKLLITDKLLLTFHARELEWITLHELAHARRYHYVVRLLPTLVALPTLYLILLNIDGIPLLAGCLVLFLLFTALIAATCWWTEWDADARAIQYGCQHNNQSLLDASLEYRSVLRKLYVTNNSQRISWTHPSLSHRLEAIEKFVQRKTPSHNHLLGRPDH